MNIASDYSPDQYKFAKNQGGYSLNYINQNIIDNTSSRYETSLDFILNNDLINKIKIYDLIIVNGIWYEINEITTNIANGTTKIKLVTTNLGVGTSYTPIVASTTTTTLPPCPEADR